MASARQIRRAYEKDLPAIERQSMIYAAIKDIFREGRVSDDDALRAMEMVCADYDEEIANLSVSWAEVQVPWRGR